MYLSLVYVAFGGGSGRGLAPARGHVGLLYVTILYVHGSLCIMNGALAPGHTTLYM
jgi:hypothetical protein